MDPLIERHGEDKTTNSQKIDHANDEEFVLHNSVFVKVLIFEE